MAKKIFNYFEKFVEQMALSRKAAQQLMDIVENYTDVTAKAEKIHETEHEADDLLHEILGELNRSFITPIDREDILSLVRELDDITDSIEDVARLFDMLSITQIKPEAIDMAKLILAGCHALYDAVVEFANFKTSKKLSDLTIKVNQAEEEGDKMHRNVLKTIYADEKDPITVIKWTKIFNSMESVLDDCEDVADLLDGLTIKNS